MAKVEIIFIRSYKLRIANKERIVATKEEKEFGQAKKMNIHKFMSPFGITINDESP